MCMSVRGIFFLIKFYGLKEDNLFFERVVVDLNASLDIWKLLSRGVCSFDDRVSMNSLENPKHGDAPGSCCRGEHG